MKLNKRYKRNIKSSLSSYISMALLTFLSVLLYLSLAGGVNGERAYIDEFRKTANVEDGQFTLYNDLTESDVSNLEKQYDVELEKQRYVDYESDAGYTIRIFQDNKKINGYVVTKGEDISSDKDVLVSARFAETNGIEIGDVLSVGELDYSVSGYFERVDYLLMLKNITDSYYVPSEFGIATISKQSFDQFDATDIKEYYSVVYNKDNEIEFRKNLYEKFMTSSYTSAESNPRIASPLTTIESMEMASGVLLPVMLMFVVILVAVVLGRKVKSEHKQIGILAALGYHKKELALHYSLFGLIPGILGSVLGVVISLPVLPAMATMLFADIEPLPVSYTSNAVQIIISLVLPAVVYSVFAYITAYRIMSKDVVLMIHGGKSDSSKTKLRMKNSKLHFKTKFRLRTIFGNMSRTLVVILGVCVGGIILVYSFACMDSFKQYVDVSVDEAGNYEYQYVLNELKTDDLEEGTKVITTTFQVDGYDSTIMLTGLDDDSYLDLKNQTGDSVRINEGDYYISTMGAMAFGIETGDEVLLYDVNSMKEYSVKITGIIKNNSQNVIYSNRVTACDLLSLPDECYNAVMSDTELDYSDSEVATVITKESLRSQIQEVSDQMGAMIWIMVIFGVIICVITIYLMVNVLLTENASSISMLKVLGYHDNEIDKIVVNVYHYLIPFGIVLGVVAGYFVCKANFDASVTVYNTYIETCISAVSIIAYAILVLVSYFISILLLKRKVKKVDMVESLKDNRE